METIFNKKRVWGIFCLIMIIGLLASSIVYAESENEINANAGAQTAEELKLNRSNPENNNNRLQINNTGIKLFFSGNVIDESVWENNQQHFKLTDKDGKEIKTKAYSSADSGTDYILVVVEQGQTLNSNSEYIFTISKGLQSLEGKILSEDIVLNFTTVDTDGNAKVNMGLMVIMVVAMIGMMMFSNKRQAKKEEVKKEEKVNPYKVAKEKGKSVEEVIEKIEKDKAKKAKRLKGKNGSDDIADDEDDSDVYKVKRIRRVSEGGSTFKSGRKAEAEKKAKEEAAKKAKGTTNPKKNKKKGKKKK